jgi:hypothetical protein
MKEEAARRLGSGVERKKTRDESALSFGTGRCLLLLKPLGHSTAVAMVSTKKSQPEVDRVVVQRALALIGSPRAESRKSV